MATVQRGRRRPRWPEQHVAAADHAPRSGGRAELLLPPPGWFSDDDVQVGLQFAAQAAIVLANAQAYWDAHQLGQDMAEAMKSRATIEQAKGILMGAQRCSADEALQILVRASQQENRKLREMAAEIVARTAEGGRSTASS